MRFRNQALSARPFLFEARRKISRTRWICITRSRFDSMLTKISLTKTINDYCTCHRMAGAIGALLGGIRPFLAPR